MKVSSPVRRGVDGKGSTDRRFAPLARNLASRLPYIVWGAEQVTELRIIHRTHAFDRFYREALPMLNAFVESSTASETILNTVTDAANNRIGETVEDVLKWFKDRPFSQSEVRQAYESGLGESQDVSTVWGMVQGFTSVARRLNHADRKVDLERRAGALLRVAA